jgi:hypothetical protein
MMDTFARQRCDVAHIRAESLWGIYAAAAVSASSHKPHVSAVSMTGMALVWIGRIIWFGSVVRKLNRRCSPSSGAAFVPRVSVNGRQMPANADKGRLASSANQCGTLGWLCVYSQNEVAGTPSASPP